MPLNFLSEIKKQATWDGDPKSASVPDTSTSSYAIYLWDLEQEFRVRAIGAIYTFSILLSRKSPFFLSIVKAYLI